jgi:hypothetical protein
MSGERESDWYTLMQDAVIAIESSMPSMNVTLLRDLHACLELEKVRRKQDQLNRLLVFLDRLSPKQLEEIRQRVQCMHPEAFNT